MVPPLVFCLSCFSYPQVFTLQVAPLVFSAVLLSLSFLPSSSTCLAASFISSTVFGLSLAPSSLHLYSRTASVSLLLLTACVFGDAAAQSLFASSLVLLVLLFPFCLAPIIRIAACPSLMARRRINFLVELTAWALALSCCVLSLWFLTHSTVLTLSPPHSPSLWSSVSEVAAVLAATAIVGGLASALLWLIVTPLRCEDAHMVMMGEGEGEGEGKGRQLEPEGGWAWRHGGSEAP